MWGRSDDHMQHRNSKQRQAILDAIERHGGHLTADQIHALVRPQFPRLSLGTVYRNLRMLVARGSVRELDFGAAFSYFEVARDSHYHLVCRLCGHIADADVEVDRQITALVKRSRRAAGFLIEDHRLDFIGVCRNCQSAPARSGRRKQASKSR